VRLVAFVLHEDRESAVTTASELRERLEGEGVRTGIAGAPEDVRDKRPDLVVSSEATAVLPWVPHVAAVIRDTVPLTRVTRPVHHHLSHQSRRLFSVRAT
jgi:hypothetical protein